MCSYLWIKFLKYEVFQCMHALYCICNYLWIKYNIFNVVIVSGAVFTQPHRTCCVIQVQRRRSTEASFLPETSHFSPFLLLLLPNQRPGTTATITGLCSSFLRVRRERSKGTTTSNRRRYCRGLFTGLCEMMTHSYLTVLGKKYPFRLRSHLMPHWYLQQ